MLQKFFKDSDPVIEVMDEPKPKEPYCQEDPDPGPCRMEVRDK